MRSQNKEKRTKFRFFTTTSGVWISKEDLLKYIDSHVHKLGEFWWDRKLRKLKQEIEKCYYKELED